MPIYFVLALGFFIFSIINGIRVLLALYALDLGAQPLAVGIIAATFSAMPMMLAVPAGKLMDRLGSRRPLLVAAAIVACAMLAPYFMSGMPALYLAAAMNGLGFVFFVVSLQNLVGIMSNADNRARNFSNFSLIGSAVGSIAPLCVGFSIDHSGHIATGLYLSLLCLVPLLMLVIWGGRLPGVSHRASASGGSILKTLADPGVWKVLATGSLFMSASDLFQFYMPVYGHGIGLSASAIGLVLSMSAAASFLVRIFLTRLIARFSVETVLAWALFISAAIFLLVPFFESVAILSLLAFAFGLGIGSGQPIVMMLTFNNSAQGRSAEALGLKVTVNHLTRVVTPIVFGAIGTAFGLFAVYWGNALMLGIGGLLSRPRKKGGT